VTAGEATTMITADDFRQLALSMQDAIEGAHMGHPDFRVNGRIFATLHAGDKTGMVKLTPEEQQELMRQKPAMFEPSPGAWGRGGSTTVILKAADIATIRAAMNLAWQQAVAKPPLKKRAVKKPALAAKKPAVKKSAVKNLAVKRAARRG
jgi:hypothetical protein